MIRHDSQKPAVTILDGGMGRELLRIGAPFRQPEWSALALMEAPETVAQAHQNFLDAGAQVLTTNSYALVPFHIGEQAPGRVLDLAHRSGALARGVAATVPGTLVAGSLPPLFGSYEPSRFDAAAAPASIDPLVAGLHRFVDVWLAETLGCTAEVVCAREAIRRHDPNDARPFWVSFVLTTDESPTLLSGEPLTDAVETAIDSNAQVLLFNCSTPESIISALRTVGEPCRTAGLQVGAYGNRFRSEEHEEAANEGLSSYRDDLDPPNYFTFARQWVDLGATVIGGCCGVSPAHIEELSRWFT